MSAGQILVVGAIAFIGAAFLNSRTLLDMAERQPYGWQRTVAVGLAKPLHTVSRWTGLAKPGQAVDDARGRNSGSADSFDALTTSTVPTSSSVAGATTSAGAGGAVATDAAPTSAATTAPAPATVTPLRTPTAAKPLTLWVGGDSMAAEVGQSLARIAGETGVITPTVDARISTGLTRPDYFDWPTHLIDVVNQQNPEVMVVMFGANDAQKMKLDGKVYDVSTPEWQAEYRRRVDAVMGFLTAGGTRHIYWLGQPVMRAGDFDQKQIVLEGIYREEAEKHPGVTFIHIRTMFAGPDGAFSAYLPDASGKQVLMRAQDGVHFSLAGANRVAALALQTIQADFS
jgi:uncharacterized protein